MKTKKRSPKGSPPASAINDAGRTEPKAPLTGIAMLTEFRLKLEREIAEAKLKRLSALVTTFEHLDRGLKLHARHTRAENAFWTAFRKGLRGEVE